MQFFFAHSSSLHRFSCSMALPSKVFTWSLSDCECSWWPLMKTWHSLGPNTNPWGTPLVAGCQLEKEPFTPLWGLPVVSSPPSAQVACPHCYTPASPGGCARLQRNPWRNTGRHCAWFVPHQPSRLLCCRGWTCAGFSQSPVFSDLQWTLPEGFVA